MIGNIIVTLLTLYLTAVFLITVWERLKSWKAARIPAVDIDPPEDEDEPPAEPPEPDGKPGKVLPGDMARYESEYLVNEQLYFALLDEIKAGKKSDIDARQAIHQYENSIKSAQFEKERQTARKEIEKLQKAIERTARRRTVLLSKLATTESRLNALARKMELAEMEEDKQ